MRYGFVILIILLRTAIDLNAQANDPPQKLELSFRNIDYTNGLLSNTVTSITQDQKGFIWIGSLKGLQRYDGLRFITYSNSAVSGLYADKKQNSILFQTPDYEINQLHLLSNKINRLDLKNAFSEEAKKYTDWNGNDWLIGCDYFCNDKAGKTVSGYSIVKAPDSKDNYHASILKDRSQNKTWINNTVYGLLLLDDGTRKVYSPDHNAIGDPLLLQFKDKKILPRKLVKDSHGNIWLFTWEWMFYRFNTLTGEFKSYSTADIIASQDKKSNQKGWVTSILEDNHGTIWIATANAGLLQYDPVKDIFNYVLPEQRNSSSIQFNYEIFGLFQDRDENIWAATDKGISIFNPYRKYFTILRNDESNPRSLPKSEITALIETSKGDLLAGTWGGGITVYDKQLQFKNNISFKEDYSKNQVWCFIENDDGQIWAGCQHGNVHIIDPGNFSVQTIHPPELENSTIRCMKKDRQGNIWLGLHNGKIAKWDRANKTFYSFNQTAKDDSLITSPIVNIFIDGSQHFWISAWKDFKQFDPVNMMFMANYRDKNIFASGTAVNYYDIEEFNDSTLVVGTENGGLNFFNKNSKTFSHLPINEDNAPYSAYAVKKDPAGDIWFTADYDIYKFNPRTNKFIACKPEKGMITSSFPSSHFYVTRKGQWFTWSFAEVLGFYPDSINQRQNNKTPITITGFKVFDKPVFIDSFLYAGKPVHLSHKQNFLTIEFASLNFSGIQHTKYYYQLTGVDKDWVFAGTKLSANYTNLGPGEYSFRVKGESEDHADQVTSFTIIIATPFWQTTWFRVLCLLFAAAFISIIVRWRIRSIRHEAGLKHRIAETEMMALRAQMNPHFIFNCLNAIDNLIQTNQKSKATSYLNRFAKMIRSVLDSSKNNLVTFHKDYETLKLFLELEQFRCSDKFQYELKVDPELLNSDIKVPTLIVQPFVENAIHHGLVNKEEGDCKLTIDIRLEKEYIKYTIIDNGIGRKQAALLKAMNKPEHVPYGIEISKKRVELHNHNGIHESILITDLEKDNRAAGTKVEFWLSQQ